MSGSIGSARYNEETRRSEPNVIKNPEIISCSSCSAFSLACPHLLPCSKIHRRLCLQRQNEQSVVAGWRSFEQPQGAFTWQCALY